MFISLESDKNVSVINLKSQTPPKCFDFLGISVKQEMLRYWQVTWSLHSFASTSAFCAASSEPESVENVILIFAVIEVNLDFSLLNKLQ